MSTRAFVSRFSPNRTDPAVLEAIFVQRHTLADAWFERLCDSVRTEAKHHLLAVGPRGCGKSHLVALLVGRLRREPGVTERVRIAWLPEDETTPSFWKFMLRILRALAAEYGDEFPPPPREELVGASDERRAEFLSRYLLEKLGDRVLLVVVENLDSVLSGLGDEGQKRWRAFLQEHPVSATLASSQQLTKDISSRERPFFNFFQIEHLQPLSGDEALELLEKLALHSRNDELYAFLQTSTGRARVRAIRHVAGGSHRVFIILSEFATRENLDHLVTAFEELLDELTPYYQERLRWLPDQQREIVEFLCRQTLTVPVKTIARELFLSEQGAAAQLKGLRDKGYVTSSSIGRESRYELAEPLMRLCIEVKDPQREPIRLIVEFLRIWYDRPEFESRFKDALENPGLERQYYDAVRQAYDGGTPDPVEEALDRDLAAARESGDEEKLAQVLEDLAQTSSSTTRCVDAGYELGQLGRNSEALQAFERAVELDPTNAASWNNKGVAASRLGRGNEALASYELAIEIQEGYVTALTNKGWLLGKMGRTNEALALADSTIAVHPDAIEVLLLKAWLLTELRLFEEVLSTCDRATEVAPQTAYSLLSKAHALGNQGRPEDALSASARAAELEPENHIAWNNIGAALSELGRFAEALQPLDRALEIDPDHARSWINKGLALKALNRLDEAASAFQAAVDLQPDYAFLRRELAGALADAGRSEEATAASDRAIELDPEDAEAWDTRARVRLGLGQVALARDDLDRSLELDPERTSVHELQALAAVLERAASTLTSVLSARFALGSSSSGSARWNHLPRVLAALLAWRADEAGGPPSARALADLAANALRSQEGVAAEGAQTAAPHHTARPLALLGDALVRSLREPTYSEVDPETLEAWVAAWRESAQRHPDLALAVRLLEVGARYVRSGDERNLLDLVQEERQILRDLFQLDQDEERAD